MQRIDLDFDTTLLTSWLLEKGWLASGESIQSIEKPGEGNMNVVLRLKTHRRNLILKQSRSYVNKYQDIPAPLDRIEVENEFYQHIDGVTVSEMVPRILAFDPENYLMLMEDLGNGTDLTTHYETRTFPDTDLEELLDFLRKVHQQKVRIFPANLDLRRLNHQHIFVLPFLEENGFQLDDIQEGLQELSLIYKTDNQLKSIIQALGEQYLSEGHTLLHGDYYPGSWLRSNEQVYVIDPEFSFLGYPEFDLGVMAAHLVLITSDEKLMEALIRGYGSPFREKLMRQIAGTEIMRRLIGLAQLPLKRSLEEKEQLLQMARKLIV